MKRYEVRAIGSGHWGVTLAAGDELAVIERVAQQEHWKHVNGVAVVDRRERTATIRGRTVPLNMAFAEQTTTPVVTDDIPTTEVRK